jgi:hypothetical protein
LPPVNWLGVNRGNLAMIGADIGAGAGAGRGAGAGLGVATAAAPSAWAFRAPSARYGHMGRTGQPSQAREIGPSGGAASEWWLEDDAGAEELQAVLEAIGGAGCTLLQVPPVHLAAAVAVLRPTPVRVAARIAGPGALATTKLFDAGECLRLGADEIAWPLESGGENGGAEIAAAAALCHDAGARLKLLLPAAGGPAALPAMLAWARGRGADAVAVRGVGAAGHGWSAPAGALAGVFAL